MKPVWIVDDDRSIRWVIEKALSREGIAFNSFSTAQEALAAHSLRQVGTQHLDGDGATVLYVARKVHGGHAAVAKFALD